MSKQGDIIHEVLKATNSYIRFANIILKDHTDIVLDNPELVALTKEFVLTAEAVQMIENLKDETDN